MKLCLIIILISFFVSFSLGQKPSSSSEKTKTFGSSLERYKIKKQKNEKQQDSQQNRKIEEPKDDGIIRVDTDLVVNDVLVTDQNGNVIRGLEKGDFIVMEDGAPQKIEVFSLDENSSVPRSILLITDDYGYQASYLKNSILAAKVLVDKLNPEDKMAIVTVNVKLWMNFTPDKTLLKKALDSLEKEGVKYGSGLEFDTLLAVLNEMFGEENRQQIIIFQGDGSEIIWLKPDKDSPYPVSNSTREMSGMRYIGKKKAMNNFGFSEVKEAIEKSRATIYSVIPGIKFLGFSKKERLARAKTVHLNTFKYWGLDERYLLRTVGRYQGRDAELLTAGQTAMFRVAELSGGSTSFIEKPEDAENVYANIFENIKNRYVIGYYPANQEQDVKLRNVKIEVRGHPEYIVTGRKTYLPR